ncbi:MAG TPA: hypothetical protein VLF59_05270 [Candidatus Saccharimonadales bacterium]|nr:hypothetical protein [Candidatus Saccharimonadales bacterium]
MSLESGRLPYVDELSYAAERALYVRRDEVIEAARSVGRLIRAHPTKESRRGDTARNIVFSIADERNRVRSLMLGGVAIGLDLSIAFWSSPESRHSRLITAGKRPTVIISHTHAPTSALSMMDMSVRRGTELSPQDRAEYLQRFNAVRSKQNIRPFENITMTKELYVAVPSDDPSMTTVPVTAYDEHMQEHPANYPITAGQIFGRTAL